MHKNPEKILIINNLQRFSIEYQSARPFQKKADAIEREAAIGVGVHDRKLRFPLSRKRFRP